MASYWYFGSRVKDSNAQRRGAEVAIWNANVFSDAKSAANAAASEMVTNVGKAFFIQGFDKPLKLDDKGIAVGFMEVAK